MNYIRNLSKSEESDCSNCCSSWCKSIIGGAFNEHQFHGTGSVPEFGTEFVCFVLSCSKDDFPFTGFSDFPGKLLEVFDWVWGEWTDGLLAHVFAPHLGTFRHPEVIICYHAVTSIVVVPHKEICERHIDELSLKVFFIVSDVVWIFIYLSWVVFWKLCY